MRWELIETAPRPAAWNMACDEALLIRLIEEGGPPVVRLYGWNPPAVTIGYSQRPDSVVNREACARRGITVTRRITGGGAVFHEHEITYSIVAPSPMFGKNARESFGRISAALAAALKTFGLDAVFAPANDVLVNGRKISGGARAVRKGACLHHGTLLLRLDREKMFDLLAVPEEKIERKGLARPSDRVTSLEDELGRRVSFREAAAALRAGFEEWFSGPPLAAAPDQEVLSLARSLEKLKYSTEEWNEKRSIRAQKGKKSGNTDGHE